MIAELHGCGCGCGGRCRDAYLGQDPTTDPNYIDLSSTDFGASQPSLIDIAPIAPTEFIDPSTGLPLSSSIDLMPAPGPINTSLPPDTYAAYGVLPTSLPPADVSAADISLMPTPSVVGGGGSVAADILAGGSAGAGLLASLKSLFSGKPTPPYGYTYNSAGQLVPKPMVAGVPTSTNPFSSLGSWLQGSSMISGVPNWALLGGGFVGLAVVAGGFGSSRRRR